MPECQFQISFFGQRTCPVTATHRVVGECPAGHALAPLPTCDGHTGHCTSQEIPCPTCRRPVTVTAHPLDELDLWLVDLRTPPPADPEPDVRLRLAPGALAEQTVVRAVLDHTPEGDTP